MNVARDTLFRARVETPISDEELASIAERASRQASRTSSVSHTSEARQLNRQESETNIEKATRKTMSSSSPLPFRGQVSVRNEVKSGDDTEDNDEEWKDVNAHRSVGSSEGSEEGDLSLPSVILAELSSPQKRGSFPGEFEKNKSKPRDVSLRSSFSETRKGLGGAAHSAVHQEYILRIEQLAEQLEQALQARRLVEVDAQRKVRDAGDIAHKAQLEASAAAAQARTAQEAAETSEKRSREFLTASRSQIADAISSAALAVSGSAAASNIDAKPNSPMNAALQLMSELQRLPMDALSPRQFVQLTVLEHLMSIQARCDALNRSLEQREAVLQSNRDSAERERLSLSQSFSVAQSREAHANERATLAETTSKRLQSKLDVALADLESYKAKASSFDALSVKRDDLESKLLQSAEQALTLTAKLEALREDRNSLNTRVEAQQVRIEALLSEKLSALASLEETRSRCKSLEDNADRLESLARDAAKSRDSLSEQLLLRSSADYNNGGGLEDRVEGELRRFRDEREHHMESIRLERSELHDREIRVMRESRSEAIAECARLRDLLASQTSESAEQRLHLIHRTEQAEGIAAESRAQFKLRSLEFEQLRTVHADTLDQLQSQSTMNEVLREKLSLVSTEFARLEAVSETQQAGLSARLEAEKARREEYEAMETKLDELVLASASASATTLDIHKDGGHHPDDIINSLAIPSSSQRRMQQAIGLARDLLSTKAEMSALQTRNDSLKAMCEQARSEATLLRKQLDAVGGPQEYFIRMLRDREDELKKAREDVAEFRSQLSSANKLGLSLASAKDKLEGEVRLFRDKLSASASIEANLRASLLESSFVKTVSSNAALAFVPPAAGEQQLQPSLHGGGSPTPLQRSQRLNTGLLGSPTVSSAPKKKTTRGEPSSSEFSADAPLAEGISINSEITSPRTWQLTNNSGHPPMASSSTTLNFFTVNSVDSVTAGGREALKPITATANVVVRSLGGGKSEVSQSAPLPKWFQRR